MLPPEEIYTKAHAAIRAEPDHVKPEPKQVTKKRWNKKKQTLNDRRNKVEQKKKAILKKLEGDKTAA